jgi:RimJ/RimL family protein N-acetyltransferase
VVIRPLTREDLDVMSAWPAFKDPLYRLFDWPQRSLRDNDRWFSQLMLDRTRVYYAVDNELDLLIGRISLRDIRGRRSARLGIGFGPSFVGQGYGTEALHLFLAYYFRDLGFEQMVLDVSASNQRAVRCYKRCGFHYVGSHYQYAGTDTEVAFLEQEPYQYLQRFFKRDGHRNLMLAYDMVLHRGDWLAHQTE